ncbi:Yip1 family protein [Streptomyces sp. KMM 9044]|uniref:Yip1 family protein n=1 Tax=Streptomyces sp. KMM 9044 TaxID=2744474 RepID=UPI0021515E01|nr:Yip1 family protein [Streptomyces sp. KMM 9044]WAX78969.1 Yip1 family protein [Streptomyces sp. KMM 9044]
MSQLGSKAGPETPGPARGSPGPGTFDNVAGFRIGRGRDNNGAPHTRPQHPPYGQQTPGPSYGSPQAPQPYPPQQPPYGRGGNGGGGNGGGWPQVNRGPGGPGGGYGGPPGPGRGGGHGEPEYFGDGGAYPPGSHAPHDPYAADNPGHTQAFQVNDDPYHGDAAPLPGPVGPRLPWKALLKGIVTAPDRTFLQMRDYTVWGPALVVTFLYGLLAVFGFDGDREEAINAIPIVLMTAVAMVISFLILGVVTHSLARQLGGNGNWQPTVGLSMLIASLTDAPRLILAMFASGDATFVQIVGWATWVAGGALLTLMVSRSHDLSWPKALGASAIQLLALLSLIKLGTL